jgi:hypothetical protein
MEDEGAEDESWADATAKATAETKIEARILTVVLCLFGTIELRSDSL